MCVQFNIEVKRFCGSEELVVFFVQMDTVEPLISQQEGIVSLVLSYNEYYQYENR